MATLILDENLNIEEYSESGKTLNFVLSEEKYEEVKAFKDKTGFTLLMYISDSLMTDIIIGCDKWEDCILFDMNDKKFSFSIEGKNKESFDMSRKGLAQIRKYKIDAILDND